LAQILVTFHLMDYHEMTCLTLGFSVLGFVATLFLPKVATSIYFNRQKDASLDLVEESQNDQNHTEPSACSRLWEDFKDAYSNSSILKWSLWWALASAGQYQVVNYVQALWEKINEENQLEPYNGVVKALHTFLSNTFTKYFIFSDK
jgi:thiamine transporter 2/3